MAQRYFTFFDTVTVDGIEISDLFRQFSFKDYLTGSDDLYNFINVTDQDSMESLAEFFYGSRSYYWILMLSNKYKDFFYDWPLKDNEIKAYVDKRVIELRTDAGSDSNFITLYGKYTQTGSTYQEVYSAVQGTMYNDLVTENDSRRTIKYLKPRFVQQLLSAMKQRSA